MGGAEKGTLVPTREVKNKLRPLGGIRGFLFPADVGNMVGNENLHGTRGQEISPNNLLLLLASPRGVEPRLQA